MNAFGVNLPEKEQKRITPSMFSLPSANNNNIQTSAVAQPKQTQPKANWYSGSQPTVGETIAQIYNVGKDNPDVLSQLNDMFNAEIMNPESNLYQPYLMPTTDKVNDTNIRNTNNATNEWNQLQAELAYWANRTDRNYSDDEIINRIDMSKYPTLAKMDAYKTTGVTMDLLAPVGYSKDAMYGVLWSARNGGQTSGNYLVDSAQGIMGNGNKYQRDEALYGRRDATSDNYAPYTVGATALDDLSYKYGMQGDFTEEWLNGEGRVLLNGDEQSRKDYNRIYNTVMNTNKLDEQAAKFNKDVEKAIAAGIDPEVFFKPETIEEYYPELAKALEGQRGGKLYETSRAVNFDYNKAVRDMKANFDKLHGTKSDEEFESEIGTSTGSEFFGNEADQLTNQIKWLDTNVNLPDFVPIASGREIDSMRLRASSTYGDVSSWVGNSVTNGTGGDLENKIALQTSAHDFANNNLFSAWDDFNYNSRTPQDFLGKDAKAFMEKYFPEQLAAGVLPTDEEFEAVRSMQEDPKSFLFSWHQVQNEAIKALGEDAALRKEAADAAQLRIDEIYDDFAEVYGEGTDQYNAAINTYKMAYEYKDGLPKVWSAFDEYQLYTQSEGVLPETFGTQLENSIGDVSRQILKVAGLIENAKVANMPQKVIANMENHLADLRNQKIVLDAHKLSNEEDYSNQVASFDKEYTLKFAQSLPESSHEEDVLSLIIDKTAYDYLYTDTTAPPEYIVDLIDAIDSMTDEERSNYKYLVVAKGLAEATAYFDALYENLTVRNAEEIEQRTREEANESFAGSAVSTAISPLLTLAEGQDALGALVTLALGGDYNPYEFHASRVKGAMREGSKTNLMEWTDGWGEWAKENISPIAGLLYDGMAGIADSMLAKNFGKGGSAAVMALSGFNNALTDAAERGAMDDSAFLYALSCAAIEGATEHFSFKRLAAAFKNGSNAVTKEQVEGFLKTVIKGLVGEGSEELISGFGSTIADDVFLQSMSQYSTLVKQYREVAGLNYEEAARQATKDILSGLMYQFAAGGIGGVFGSAMEYGKGYALKKIGAISETPPTPSGGKPVGDVGADSPIVETEGDIVEPIPEQIVSEENQEVQSSQESYENETVVTEQPVDNQPIEEQTAEETATVEQTSGSNIARASAALATATKDGVSASQQTATVEGVLRSFGLDEMEASAAAKNIVSSGNLRVLRKILSNTTNPEMVIKAIAMGSVVEDSESAAVFKSPITSKNAHDVSEQLISAYEADRINKHATSAYDANVAFSAEADITTDILKTQVKMDHTAEEEAVSKVKEAEKVSQDTLSVMNAAQSEFDNATKAFNENPFDDALKERFKKAFDLLQKRTEEHLNAAGKLGEARRNVERVREAANEQRGVNIVAARESAKAQVAEQVQQKREAQEANVKKEAEASTANDNAVQAANETVVNEVPAVSEAETAAKTKLDEAQQKFDEAKGKEVEAARNLGNAVAKYNENTSDPQAKAEMEAAMKVLDSANAESVAAEEDLKNAKAEYDSVSQQNNQPPVNQNIQQKAPSAHVVAQNPQIVTPSAEQAVNNESNVVAETAASEPVITAPDTVSNQPDVTNKTPAEMVIDYVDDVVAQEVAKYKAELDAGNEQFREQYKAKVAELNSRNKHRRRIMKVSGEIIRMLEHPTGKKHVIAGLDTAVVDFLKVLDLGTRGKKIQDLNARIKDVANAFEENNEDPDSTFYMTEDMLETMKILSEETASLDSIGKLTTDQMRDLRNMVDSVKHVISTADKLFRSKRSARVSDVANRTIQQLSERADVKRGEGFFSQARDMLKIGMLDSFHFFDGMGSAAKEVFTAVREGFDKNTVNLQEAISVMQEASKGVDPSLFEQGKKLQTKTYALESGETIALSKPQLMELYCLSKRGKAKTHLLNGGIRTKDNVSGVKLTENDINNLVDNLTFSEKALADKIQNFMATRCSELANETSMELSGYRKFGEENYYPMHVDQNTTKTRSTSEAPNTDLYGILNKGFTKDTKNKAKNKLMIGSIFETFSQYFNDVSIYNAYAAPVYDMIRWLNYKPSNGSGVKTSIEQKIGSAGIRFITNLIADVNASGDVGHSTGPLNTLLRNAKSAAVGNNIRVVIQQPTSIVRAAFVMNPSYIASSIVATPSQVRDSIKKAQDYCPIAAWKSLGFYETNIGKSLQELLFPMKTSLREKGISLSMKMAGKADEYTFAALWRACEKETKAKNPGLTGHELYKETGKRLSEVIDYTQVVDTPLHKTEVMRSKDTGMKMSTSFMSENMKTYNVLQGAFQNAKNNPNSKSAKQSLKRAVVVYVANGIINAVAQSLWDGVRGAGEDDDKYIERVLKAFFGDYEKSDSVGDYVKEFLGSNVVSSMNPLSMIPFVKEVVSMLQGYDSTRMELQPIEKMVSLVQQMEKLISGESEWNTYKWIRSGASLISYATGVSVEAPIKDLTGFFNLFAEQLGVDPIVSRTSSVGITEQATNMYNAILAGNKDKFDRWSDQAKNGNTPKNDNDIDLEIASVLAKRDERCRVGGEAKTAGDASLVAQIREELVAELTSTGVIDEARAREIVEKAIDSHTPTEKQEFDPDKKLNTKMYTSTDFVNALVSMAGSNNENVTNEDLQLIFSELVADSTAEDRESSTNSNISKAIKKYYIENYGENVSSGLIDGLDSVLMEVMGIPFQKLERWKEEAEEE